MRQRLIAIRGGWVVCWTIIFASFLPARVLAAVSCESLSALVLPDTTITIAQFMAAGGFPQPGS